MSEHDKKKKSGGIFGRLFGGSGGSEPAPSPAEQAMGDETAGADANRDAEVGDAGLEKVAPDADVQHAQDSPTIDDEKGDALPAVFEGDQQKDVADKPQDKPKSWLSRLTSGLTKTSSRLSESITGLFTQRKLDEETLDDFEDILIQSDLGVETAMRIRDQLSSGRFEKGASAEDVQKILADEVSRVLEPTAKALKIEASRKPHIILVVGVNGSGKTTTIGKLAAQFKSNGHKVMIAAGDTFRAAAIDQLKVWGERAGVPVVSRDVGADASGLAFDAVSQAQQDGIDVLMIDTAGRLQNKQALMEELEKVIRVVKKLVPEAPHDTLLVLDATTGQNAMSQVEAFRATAGVTGLIMTKLDGTARGGILVAIADKFGLPVHAIGVGEGIDDLQPFSAADFAAAIAGR